ncbi:MAG: hypothetical protein AB2L12_08615 [Smithellaceae bacterium]
MNLHLVAAVRYVENNPVAAGIVKHAWEYPWSSAAAGKVWKKEKADKLKQMLWKSPEITN